MKKTFIYIAVICAAMFAGVSCEKIEQPVQVKDDSQEVIESELPEGGDYVVKFSLSMADDQTKTGFDSGTGIEWKKDDEIVFYQRYFQKEDDTKMVRQPYTHKVTENTNELIAEASFGLPYKEEVQYIAFYPKSNLPGGFLTLANKLMGQVSLPENQKPSKESFDPKADILISKYLVTTPSAKPTSFKLQFERMNAIGKMTIRNLQSNSDISSLMFTAETQSGGEVVLAGSTYYKFEPEIGYTTYDYSESSTPAYNTSKQKAITLDYSEEQFSLCGETGGTAYFCCYPFELGEGDSFKLVITTTAGEVFTKTVEIPTGRELKFERGKGTKFTVDMSGGEATVTVGETTTTYPTISAAFTAANDAASAATIKLMKNCTASAPLTVSKENADITLDLNGKTLTEANATPAKRITVEKGTLNITSSSDDGTITASNLAYLIYSTGGTVNINDDKVIVINQRTGDDTWYVFYVKGINTALNISGGKYNSNSNVFHTSDGGKVSVSGGYFSKEVTNLSENHSCYKTDEFTDYPYSVLPKGVALFRQGTDKVESKASINEAISAASSATDKECTITLVDHCQVSGSSAVNVTNSAGVTLDLNGKTLTQNSASRLGVSGSGYLKIIDSKQDGKITQTAKGSNTFSISSGTLEIAGGSIEQASGATVANMNITGSANITVSDDGKITGVGTNAISFDSSEYLTVEGGTIISENQTSDENNHYAIALTKGHLTVKNGTIQLKTSSSKVTAVVGSTGSETTSITINGGSLTASSGTGYGLYVNNPNCTVNINDGQISSNVNHAIYIRKGKWTISGGKILSSATQNYALCITSEFEDNNYVNITGGQLISINYSPVYVGATTGSVSISGDAYFYSGESGASPKIFRFATSHINVIASAGFYGCASADFVQNRIGVTVDDEYEIKELAPQESDTDGNTYKFKVVVKQ